MCLYICYFVLAEQLNKDIPHQVQDMTYKIAELEKTLLMLSASQIPRIQGNITAFNTRVCFFAQN